MDKKPLVSIVIACYNAEPYIDLCMESLMNQSYQNFEIIVCDDASTDNSLLKLNDWSKKDSRIIILKNEKNMYAAATRNKCIEVSNGKYIMIQDVDDYSDVTRIEKLISILETEKDIDFVSTSMDCFSETPGTSTGILKLKHMYPEKKHFLWNLPFNHPTTMFTRECLLCVNGYRVEKITRRGEDYDMFMRLYAEGYKGKNFDEALYFYRLDIENIKRRTLSARVDEFKIRKHGFKLLKLYPLGYLFLLKPFLAHLIQKIRYNKLK